MGAGRLVHLLLLLETRERASARELAAALEVSVRTVHRDIDALSRAGVPVYAERGSRGGFRLLGARHFQVNALTEAEAAALPVSALPSIAGELGISAPAGAAWLKVESALPEATRLRARQAASHLLVDLERPPRARDTTVAPQMIRGLWGAIERRRVLSVRTREPCGEVTVRDIEPLGIVWHDYAWHLVARDRRGIRSIPAHSIELARATGSTYEAVPGFDLERWWQRRKESNAGQSTDDQSRPLHPDSKRDIRSGR